MMKKETKVVIIGCGAAGLMAASILKEKKIPFICLEFSDRVGGRALTMKDYPHIELGPEFLHGETPLTDKLLERYNLPYYDLNFDYHLFEKNRLIRVSSFWDKLCEIISRINPDGKDVSIKDYLQDMNDVSDADKNLFKAFVQGFDAADLSLMSTRALGDMKEQVCDEPSRRMRRPLTGYSPLMEKLASEVWQEITFFHEVKEIIWEKNKVLLRGVQQHGKKDFEIRCEKVICTVSVAVLRKLSITPLPDDIRAFLEQVEMGQVVKLVAELTPEFFTGFPKNAFPFIASPELNFTAWWTTTPIHSNTVTAWAGGEKARNLIKHSTDEIKDIFCLELGKLTGDTKKSISPLIKTIHFHDWARDPAVLGAYSYPRVIERERRKIHTSFKDTLFFAGEAFHEEFTGTIEGAFQTGKAAALQVVKKTEHYSFEKLPDHQASQQSRHFH